MRALLREQVEAPAGTVASALLAYLARRGVSKIFGVVGREASAILFDENAQIEFVLTRHEFTAGVAADVEARITGRPAVCFSTLGPGVTNLATSVACAYLDRSPLIAIAAQAETVDGIPGQTHQCLDSVALMKPITKFSTEARTANDVLPALEECFRIASEEPVGPVFLSIPIDVLSKTTEQTGQRSVIDHVSTTRRAAPEEDFREALTVLREANAPVVAIGHAAVRAGLAETLAHECERLQLPAVTTYAAKGAVPAGHPLFAGTLSPYMDGILERRALDEIFEDADVIVLAGYDYAEDFRPSMWRRGREKTTIRIGTIPNPAAALFTPDVDLYGDVAATCERMFGALGDVDFGPRGSDLAARMREARVLASNDRSDEPGVVAQHAILAVNAAKQPDAIVVSDIGFFRHYAALFTDCATPNTFITSAGGSSFGFGLPAGIGAKLTCPDKQVIVVAGDGGFHSGSHDLETLARLDLPVVVVVLNNNSSALIRLYQRLGHGRDNPKAVDFAPVDFVALARANGCAGVAVTTADELRDEIVRATASRRPTLIEVPLKYDYAPAADFGALRI